MHKTIIKCNCGCELCGITAELVDNDLVLSDNKSLSIGIILSSNNIDVLIDELIRLKNNPTVLNSSRLGYDENGIKFGQV